jgi:hypothetical protein
MAGETEVFRMIFHIKVVPECDDFLSIMCEKTKHSARQTFHYRLWVRLENSAWRILQRHLLRTL